MTIVEAIKKVMLAAARPLSSREAFEAIVTQGLYQFQAKDPQHVVLMQIRRHCVGIDFPTASPTKHFKLHGDNTYVPLDRPTGRSNGSRETYKKSHKGVQEDLLAKNEKPEFSRLSSIEKDLWEVHKRYLVHFKQKMLQELKRMSPTAFEAFGRELLDGYGFENTQVTNVSGDGGIDGFGRLKVGLAHLNVAFQCKRWKTTTIQRPEIDRFRGAAQGAYEQGIFFTTSTFSSGAIGASIKPGAIPIVLVDGLAIVDLMIQKKIRIESTLMEIPAFAL
ncbi:MULTISPECIES: restriction endonuclease [Burkholderia]|uniref:restriction endonuclease n=1 Tax=Burkholderia TaxID=32008 RepID=UPI000536EDD9|nr:MULTISPECIES: restriction endonuclease [Burkholderia]KAA8764438.1 restriction endonuclease [Burkholderia pseudomallei]KGW59024.1 HB1, ASXL, restriction endonuclease HTH domain protein [Burkholderia pseudomallei MSHR1357]KKC15452.1 restriction endonuclease family protein [Burkholderia pseudomallei MSHR1328]